MDKNQVCFDTSTFTIYMFLLVCVLGYLVYFRLCADYESNVLQSLLQMKDRDQRILQLIESKQETKQEIRQEPSNQYINNKFMNKIFNPLSPPENIIPEGSFTEPGYDANMLFQQTGFITGPSGRFPIYSRYHDSRSDRLEYYTIDDSRGRIKIPIKTKNYAEIYDGDNVSIPELGNDSFVFKKYESEGLRYNPRI